MSKSKGNNTAAKQKQAPRADGLRRVLWVRDGRKSLLVWMDKEGNVVA